MLLYNIFGDIKVVVNTNSSILGNHRRIDINYLLNVVNM